MNWQNHRTLALALRDQGLCDSIAVKVNLRDTTWIVSGRTTDLAHLVVAKCQQSVEKITKGYLLWTSRSFDPTRGHTPFTDTLTKATLPSREFATLCNTFNKLDRRIVKELMWLESLAPHPPQLSDEEKGKPIPLNKIEPNSEYAFWSSSANTLVVAAEGLRMAEHGVRAAKTLRNFLGVVPIRSFQVHRRYCCFSHTPPVFDLDCSGGDRRVRDSPLRPTPILVSFIQLLP